MAITISFALLAAAFAWLQLANEVWMLYLFVAIYGFAHGALFVLISPIVAELFGLSSHGVILGIIHFSGTVVGAISPALVGRIFDVTGSYQLGFLICFALSIVAVIIALFLKPTTSQGGRNDSKRSS